MFTGVRGFPSPMSCSVDSPAAFSKPLFVDDADADAAVLYRLTASDANDR